MTPASWWKKTRVKKGLRKTELARRAGVSAKTIMRLESGDSTVSEETKSKIRNALLQKLSVEK